MSRVAVFGLGYVGSVTAACLARDGHTVVGVDIDPFKLEAIARGRSPVVEPGLEQLIAQAVKTGRLRVSDDVSEAVHNSDLALITVGTPSRSDGSVASADVERVVKEVTRSIEQQARSYVIVVRSTLLPGILEERLKPIVEQINEQRGRRDRVYICNNPEFLRETTAVADYDRPPFILVGADDPGAAESVLSLYDKIPGERVVTDTRTAAMVKYACNAFHALKVDFANEIGTLAGRLGADPHEVMRIVGLDHRLNISTAYLKPGMPFGGSCLPKDVQALVRCAQEKALDLPLLASLLPSNQAHFRRALRSVRRANCRKIGLVGLSFKRGTDDLRESPLVYLAEALIGTGFDLRILDHSVRQSQLIGSNLAFVDKHLPHLARLLVSTEQELLDHAELLVLGIDYPEIRHRAQALGIAVIDLAQDVFRPLAESSAERLSYRVMTDS